MAEVREERRRNRKTPCSRPKQQAAAKAGAEEAAGRPLHDRRPTTTPSAAAIEAANTAQACGPCKALKPAERCDACKAAALPHWHPHQLRHTHATEVRRRFGLEAAQVALGHSQAQVTAGVRRARPGPGNEGGGGDRLRRTIKESSGRQ